MNTKPLPKSHGSLEITQEVLSDRRFVFSLKKNSPKCSQCFLVSLDNPLDEFQAISMNFSYVWLGERQVKFIK